MKMSKHNFSEMKKLGIDEWRCPFCLEKTIDFPAISRRDNETEICSACGTREALDDWKKASEKKIDLSERANDSLLIASQVLITKEILTTIEDLQYFYEKPHKFREELEILGFEVKVK